METIIEDINETEIQSNPSYALKVNSMLKKMGFKKVYMTRKRIEELTYEKELTLYVTPSYEESLSCSNEVYLSGSPLRNKLRGLNGCGDSDYLKCCTLDRIPINLVDGEINQEIGCYLKERNIVILFYNINYSQHTYGKKNELMFYFLNYLTKWIKENPIETIDVGDKIKNMVYQKFTSETKKQINNLLREIRNSENSLKEYYEAIAENINRVKESKINCVALQHGLKNMGQKIDDDMKEIKKLKFVKRVGISGLGIRVDFDEIKIKVEEEDIFMGNYYVYLLPTKIKITNKNPIKYNGCTFHSPHIMGESICFGNDKLKVYQLLGEGAYKKVIHFIYLYLKSYNASDTYVSMDNWIKARENNDEYRGSGEDE